MYKTKKKKLQKRYVNVVYSLLNSIVYCLLAWMPYWRKNHINSDGRRLSGIIIVLLLVSWIIKYWNNNMHIVFSYPDMSGLTCPFFPFPSPMIFSHIFPSSPLSLSSDFTHSHSPPPSKWNQKKIVLEWQPSKNGKCCNSPLNYKREKTNSINYCV